MIKNIDIEIEIKKILKHFLARSGNLWVTVYKVYVTSNEKDELQDGMYTYTVFNHNVKRDDAKKVKYTPPPLIVNQIIKLNYFGYSQPTKYTIPGTLGEIKSSIEEITDQLENPVIRKNGKLERVDRDENIKVASLSGKISSLEYKIKMLQEEIRSMTRERRELEEEIEKLKERKNELEQFSDVEALYKVASYIVKNFFGYSDGKVTMKINLELLKKVIENKEDFFYRDIIDIEHH